MQIVNNIDDNLLA